MGTQVYVLLGFLVALGLGIGAVYHAGAESAENENRLKSLEALRVAERHHAQRATTEREGRQAAEKSAEDAEARGRQLAAAVERLKDTEQCPAVCFRVKWGEKP